MGIFELNGAYATSTIINIEPAFLTGALAYVGDLFSGVSLLVMLAIGLPVGFWVLRKVIGLVRVR